MSLTHNIASNIAYVISGIIAHYKKKPYYGNLLFFLAIVSCLYHLNYTFLFLDVIISISVLFYSLWITYNTPNKYYIKLLGIIFLIIMIILIPLSGKYGEKQYNIIHPWAHIFGGLSTALVAYYGKT